jgi:hypothetical protein
MRSPDGAGWIIDGWRGVGGGEFAFLGLGAWHSVASERGEWASERIRKRREWGFEIASGIWRDGRAERFKVQAIRRIDVRETSDREKWANDERSKIRSWELVQWREAGWRASR